MKEVLSEKEIERALSKLAKTLLPKRENLIPGLQLIQEELGYLPKMAMSGLARFLKVPESEVWGTATFYAQFRFHPAGRNVITVCRGTACHVRGSAGILRELERKLKIKPGETTQDLNFSLNQVACFGSCALAPVVVLNKRVYGRQTTNSVNKLVDNITKSSAKKSFSKDT